MRTRHAACGNKWPQWERVGVILYVRMRLRFVVRIRTWLTESVHVVNQNAYKHESDRKCQERRHYIRIFPTFLMAERN